MDSKFLGSKISAPNTIIAICGFAGSGKNTISNLVASELGYKLVEPTFKTLAAREGISLMEFQKKANSDFNIDKKFDDALQDECKAGKCVVATWLGPWMAPGNPFRVWLDVDEKVRAKRVAGREKLSIKEALSHIQKRDADNISRYKKVYGIDISDHDGFDLVIDANELSPKEICLEIMNKYKKRKL